MTAEKTTLQMSSLHCDHLHTNVAKKVRPILEEVMAPSEVNEQLRILCNPPLRIVRPHVLEWFTGKELEGYGMSAIATAALERAYCLRPSAESAPGLLYSLLQEEANYARDLVHWPDYADYFALLEESFSMISEPLETVVGYFETGVEARKTLLGTLKDRLQRDDLHAILQKEQRMIAPALEARGPVSMICGVLFRIVRQVLGNMEDVHDERIDGTTRTTYRHSTNRSEYLAYRWQCCKSRSPSLHLVDCPHCKKTV